MKTGSGPQAHNSLAASSECPRRVWETQSAVCVRMYRPPEIEVNFYTDALPSSRLRASFTDLVDGDGESRLDVGLHVFLPVVAEKTRSLQDGVHFRPTLGVGGQLLRRETERVF